VKLELIEFFKKAVKLLERLIGRDLSDWMVDNHVE
jgi:hypothetical protein